MKGSEGERLKEIIKWHTQIKELTLPEQFTSCGAGTRFFQFRKGNKIRASRIGISRKFGVLLHRLVQFSLPGQLIELGTGSGISTAYLAAADASIPLLTIEGSKERLEFAKQNLINLKVQNVEFINSDFDQFLNANRKFGNPLLVFIDGNHNYEATLRYFRYFSSISGENSIIVFDDIRWSGEMEKAWKEIKADARVTIAIDLFFMGIIFFRPGVSKQEYIINF